jgi:hypothetical protein
MAEGCVYLTIQVKAINCISPCLCPVLIVFNLLPIITQQSVGHRGEESKKFLEFYENENIIYGTQQRQS